MTSSTRFDVEGRVRLSLEEAPCFVALTQAYGCVRYPERELIVTLPGWPFSLPIACFLIRPGEDARWWREEISRELTHWAGKHLDAALAIPEPFDAVAFVAACMKEEALTLTEYYLDGKQMQDVVRATEDEVVILERHWRSGEIVRDPDGTPRMLTLRGKVRVEGAICAPDIVLLSDPLFPCPLCGGYECSPERCYCA